MRKIGTGRYNEEGNYIISFEGSSFSLEIKEDEVLSIGSSIGGWWPKSVLYKGQKKLVLIRISGSEKNNMEIEKIKRRHDKDRGFLLRENMTGLWALSAGAAKRGICHKLREDDGDPLKKVLREANIATSTIKTSSVVNKTEEDDFFRVLRGSDWWIVYYYPQHRNGQEYLSVEEVNITPFTDRKEVADQIRNLKGYFKV